MHELGLAQQIVDAAVAAAGGRPLVGVRARVGVVHAAEPALLAEAFGLAAAGTPAEGAALEVDVDPVRVSCRACGAATDSLDPLAGCGRCGSFEVDRAGGTELGLVSVRVRTNEPDGEAEPDPEPGPG